MPLTTYVPGVTAATFETETEAMEVPLKQLCFEIRDESLQNSLYDGNLIAYNQNYESQVYDFSGDIQLSSKQYIKSLTEFLLRKRIVEIGCGQGEFLSYLHYEFGSEISLVGFDPVFRGETKNPSWTIHRQLYDFSFQGDVFVFRCVLNHFEDYNQFLSKIASANRHKTFALIEYPNLNFILKNRIWQAMGHEHVHYFTKESFKNFDIIFQGDFANEEWSYVVIELPRQRTGKVFLQRDSEISKLFEAKSAFLQSLSAGKKYAIFGASGKGTIMASAMINAGFNVTFAIDNNPNKSGRWLANSGVEIITPPEFERRSEGVEEIVIANPLHTSSVRRFFSTKYVVRE